MDVECKWPGSLHDAKVFANSSINHKMKTGQLPKTFITLLPGYEAIPNYLIGDPTYPLRPGDCKYRELIFKTEKTDFFIFCQEKPFGELFSKIRLKLAREFLILRNPTKSRIAIFTLRPQ